MKIQHSNTNDADDHLEVPIQNYVSELLILSISYFLSSDKRDK